MHLHFAVHFRLAMEHGHDHHARVSHRKFYAGLGSNFPISPATAKLIALGFSVSYCLGWYSVC